MAKSSAWWGTRHRSRARFVQLVDTADPAAAPERIHLERDDTITWRDPKQLRAIAAELSELGFQRLGSFRVPEIDEVQLAAAVHPAEGTAIVVYEHVHHGVWCEAISELADGEAILVSNARAVSKCASRPEEVKIGLPKAAPTAIVEQLREQIDGRPVVLLGVGNFAFEFEEAYARARSWHAAESTASTAEPDTANRTVAAATAVDTGESARS